MCRLLCVTSREPFPIGDYLPPFAAMARNSVEYQGDGWGYAYINADSWQTYHSILPVWEDPHDPKQKTTLLLMHARSAFQNSGIEIENNMPFIQNNSAFIFNGELRGVRMHIEGRIGAEKLFNLIRSYENTGLHQATCNAMKILEQRTSYLRAANVIISDGRRIVAASRFNENPAYFTLHRMTVAGRTVLCSEPLPMHDHWEPLAQGIYQVDA